MGEFRRGRGRRNGRRVHSRFAGSSWRTGGYPRVSHNPGFSRGLEHEAHRNHVGELKTVSLEEALRFRADPVREKGDAQEIFLAVILDDVLDEGGSIALSPVVGMDDDVFHEEDESSRGGADGDEQICHRDDLMASPDNEYTPSRRLLENETQSARLEIAVRFKILLFLEEFEEQADEIGEIFDRRGLYPHVRQWYHLIGHDSRIRSRGRSIWEY